MILNRSLTIAEIIILCLMVGFISISLITAGQSTKSSDWALMDLERNWNTDFISDIWVGYSRDCPSDQDSINYQFGGLQEYKLCQNHGLYSTEDKDSATYGCQLVSAAKSIFSVWSGTRTLCIKRMKGVNFANSAQQLSSQLTCPSHLRKCGDPKNQSGLVCIPPEYGKCPVSAFYFGLRGTVIPTSDVTFLSYNSTHDLVVERSGDPLVSVTIQEARICNGTETPPLSIGRTSFKYFVESKRECDKNIDDRFQVVNSIAEDDFLKLNDPKLADLLLNSQAASGKYNYSIQARRIAPFAQSCRPTMNFVPKILEKEILVEQSASNVRFLMWLMFYFLIILILISCGAFCAHKSLYWQVRAILTLAGTLAFLILLGYWLITPNGDMKQLKQAASRSCSDPFTEKQLEAGRKMFKTDVLDHGWYTGFVTFVGLLGLIIVYYLQRNKHLKIMESPELLFHRTQDFYGALEDSLTGERPEAEIPEYIYNQSPQANAGLLDGQHARVRSDLRSGASSPGNKR